MIVEFIGIAALVFGLFFSIVGVVGVMRMPDIYTRLHASGKVATLGIFGLLLGAAILMPSITLKALALGLFILFTSPVSTHAIAASEYRRKEIVEELVEMQTKEGNIDMESVDITGYLSRSSVQEIIEARTRSFLEKTEDDNETSSS